MNESSHSYESVMSQANRMQASGFAAMNESGHTNEWVMSHIWISHVTGESDNSHRFRSNEWVTSHIWMNESGHTYEWVMSHIWIDHVTGESDKSRRLRSKVFSQSLLAVADYIKRHNQKFQIWLYRATQPNFWIPLYFHFIFQVNRIKANGFAARCGQIVSGDILKSVDCVGRHNRIFGFQFIWMLFCRWIG